MSIVVCLVCLSVCLSFRSHIWKPTRPNFTKFFAVHVARGRGSVLFWWCCSMLCASTSGFVDDDMLSHNVMHIPKPKRLYWYLIPTGYCSMINIDNTRRSWVAHRGEACYLWLPCYVTFVAARTVGYLLPVGGANYVNVPGFSSCRLWRHHRCHGNHSRNELEAIHRWSAICRVWPWTLTYQKSILCVSSYGQDLYSHQTLNMYIYWFSSESGYRRRRRRQRRTPQHNH